MTEIQTTHYSRYHVRPGRWQALRHALTGHGIDLDGSRVRRTGGGGAYAGSFRVPDGEPSVTLAFGGPALPYTVTGRNGGIEITGGGGAAGTGTPGASASGGPGTAPPGSRPGKHRHGPVRRICCETFDGTPHVNCPVYTPGGYVRPVGGGLQRICCPTMPGDRHGSECGLTAGQRGVLADHEALSGSYEERLTVPAPSGQPWHCASCGGEFTVLGGRLAHSDPVCSGMTRSQGDGGTRLLLLLRMQYFRI